MITATDTGLGTSTGAAPVRIPIDAGIPQSFASPMVEAFNAPWEEAEAAKRRAADEKRRATQAKLDAALLNPDEFFQKNPIRSPFVTDPEREKRALLNQAFIRHQLGGERAPAGSFGYDLLRRDLAHKLFDGRGAASDEEFHAEIVKDAGRRRDTKSLVESLQVSAFDDAMLPSDQAPGFAAWREKAKASPGYEARREADYLETWHDVRTAAAERVEEYREPLVQVWRAFRTDGNITAAAFDAWKQLPEDRRGEFLDAIAIRAKALPEEERRGFWANLSRSTELAMKDFYRAAGESAGAASFNVAAGPPGLAAFPTTLEGDAATREMRAEVATGKSEYQARRNFAADIRRIAREDYDPIKSAFGDGGKPGFWEGAAYATPGVVASSLTMAVPVVGTGIMAASMEGQAYEQLRARMLEAGLSDEDATRNAEGLAPFVAAPQMALEKVGFGIWSRKLPGFTAALDKLGDQITNRLVRGGVKTLAIGAAETGIETAQDLTSYAVQDIAAALSADVPQVKWSEALAGAWAQAPETFVTMLPLAILGAAGGLSRESRAAAFAASSPLQRRALGITDADSARIDAAAANGQNSINRAVDVAMANRNPASPEAQSAAQELRVQAASQARATQELERLGYNPVRFTQTTDGISVIDSMTGEEIGQAPDLSGAIRIGRAHTIALDDMAANQIAALGTLVEASKAAVELDPSSALELSFMSEFDPEQASSQMASRYARQVAMEEIAEGGTGNIARSVLGYSETTFAQGLRTTVNRIYAGGSVPTVFHETFHGLRRAAHAAGAVTKDMEISLLLNHDKLFAGKSVRDEMGKKTGRQLRFIPEGITAEMLRDGSIPLEMIPEEFQGNGAQYSEYLLDEGVAEIAEVEVMKLREGQGKGKLGISRSMVSRNLRALATLKPGVAGNWKAFFRAVRTHWGLAASRAIALIRAEKRGEFDPSERENYLNKLMGLDAQEEHDAGVREELNRILAMPDEVADDDIPFSIGRGMGSNERLDASANLQGIDTNTPGGANIGDSVPPALFEESNRITNLNPTGGMMTAIKRENPGFDPEVSTVTVYRSTIGKDLRPNDFVALDRNIAKDHLQNLKDRGEKGKILTFEVATDDLLMANDATEFIWYPRRFEQSPPASSGGFSLGRSTVQPSAGTRLFQGAEGSPSVIGPAAFSISAFHGTPHKVDKFTTEKIGTGEGAQAYGWGLYFAESEAVGKTYQEQLRPRPPDGTDRAFTAAAQSFLKSTGKVTTSDLRQAYPDAPEPALEWAIREATGQDRGNLYRVNLKVEDEDLLDWDKSLAEQSEKVKAALSNLLPMLPANATGSQIYKAASARAVSILGPELRGTMRENPQEATKQLQALGIRGIRYKDGNSRVSPLQIQAARRSVESWKGKNADQLRYAERELAELLKKDAEGSFNYVIFDEADIEILEENGQPVNMQAAAFSLGPADVPRIMAGNALARVQEPRRRTQAMSRIARDFDNLRLQTERLLHLSGRRRSKAELRQEANARQDLAEEEKIGRVWAKYGQLLADDDLTKIKAQPVHAYLADPTSRLRGRLMSKAAAIKAFPDRYQLHRAGEYDGAEAVSRSVFGGQLMPDQAAQELYEAGLISDPVPDLMWEALLSEQKSVAGMRELLVKAQEEIRTAKQEAKQEANEWLATQAKDQETNFSPKQEIIRSLRMLDAILLALPPEVRGKIGGGKSTQMALITTDEARLAYLKDMLAKADKQLETFLREQYAAEWLDLLRRARPDSDNPGERPTGRIAADAYDILRAAEAAMGLSFSEGEAEADRLEALADHEDTPADRAQVYSMQAQMVRLTANWTAADAARREQAVMEGERIYFGGLSALAIENSRRRERLGKLRDSAISGTGKTGKRMERETATRAAKGTRMAQAAQMAWEFMSFGQLVNVLFGEEAAVAKWANAREIAASNQLEDAFQAKTNAMESMLESLAGSRFGGEKLRHRMQTVQTITVKDALGNEEKFTDSQAITFLLMWRQEDGRRHMSGVIDDSGNVVSSWGWNDASAAEVERQLSPEGRAMMAFLGDSYGTEYGRINEVFRRIWNVSMPRHKQYAPLSVMPSQAKSDTIMDPSTGESMGIGMTPGSLKNRSATAVAEPDFRDAFQVYLTHARQMEHFIAYGEFARDMLGVINRKETRNAITAAGGPYAAATLSKWVDYFAQGGIKDAAMGGALQQFFGGALGRLSSAMLIGRVSVLAMQSMQLASAAYKMPLGAYLTRMGKLLTGRLGWGDAIRSEYIQRRLQEMPPVVRDAVRGLESGNPNRAKFLAARLGRTIAGADALFTAGTYAMLYDYHLKAARAAGVANPEATAHAEAERLTDQIAQPTRAGARSWMELSMGGQPAFRALWNFASDPRQKLSLVLYQAMRRDKSGKEKAAAFARSAAITWAVGGILQATLRAIMRDLRDDEDDEVFDERHWRIDRLAFQALTGPVGGMPFVGEIFESSTYAITGQFMKEGTMFSTITDSAGLLRKWAKGDADPLKDAETIFTGGAAVSGTSAAAASFMHVVRDAVGIYENITGD